MNCMLHQVLFLFPETPGSENLTRNPNKTPAGSYANYLLPHRLPKELVKSNHKVVNVNNGVVCCFSLLFLKHFLLRYVLMIKCKAFSSFIL